MFTQARRDGRRSARRNRTECVNRIRLRLELLEDRTLLSVNIRIAVMGDSLSAPYAGHPGRSDDRSWTEQLSILRSNHITIDNEAVAGATSSLLLAGGQHTAVANLVASGAIDYAVLIVGANDVDENLPSILAGDPTPFVTTVVANIETAVNTVTAAGDVGMVVGNIPDLSVTPAFQSSFEFLFGPYAPFFLQEVSSAVALANAQIEDFAAAQEIPVVDLFGQTHVTNSPITIGGVQIDNLYVADGLHPGTIAQGIIANSILEAFHVAYDVNVHPLRLSDQEILKEVDIGSHGRTFFDVSSFVLFSGESDAELLLPSQTDHLPLAVGWGPASQAVRNLTTGNNSTHAALDQLFADLVNDLNGLTHAAL